MEHIHLIGIGGSGLSAIARVLLESGYTVSGSDRVLSPLARSLQVQGANVYVGHRAENVLGASLVVRSSAIPDDNPEVQAAHTSGIPVLKRADFLNGLINRKGRTGIAIAGTHGKTTTTAMIAWMLSELGQDPSYIIGGVAKNLGTNAHAGHGSPFVIEADEYDHMFLGLTPDIIVVTNVDYDHPDCFPTPSLYFEAFLEFGRKLKPGGVLLACAEDHGAEQLVQKLQAPAYRTITYGFDYQAVSEADYKTIYHPDIPATYQASSLLRNSAGCFDYDAWRGSQNGNTAHLAKISLQVPGKHNVLNSLAALAVADQMGLSVTKAASALDTYMGTSRRFDVLGQAARITVINDYAHHPTEIRTTLAAARDQYPGQRLWAVWQPHTISRTRAFSTAFSSAFDNADQLVVTGIYGARENVDPQSEATLLQELVQAIAGPQTSMLQSFEEVTHFLITHLKPGDVVLVFSAGDADQISSELLNQLRSKAHE